MENKLDQLYKKVKPIFGKLELNKYSKSHFIGYNYKHAPRGKSHHWLSFGLIHEGEPEFWLNIGALKVREDFKPIKEKLIEIQKNHKSVQINERNGQCLLRISSPIKSWEEKDIEKALEDHVSIIKNIFSQLNGIGLLGLETFSVQAEQKIQRAKNSPKSIANKKTSNEESEIADLKRQLANCKMALECVNENYAEMKQSFEQTIELFSKESTSLAKKYDNGGVKGIRIVDIKKAIQDIKKKSSVVREVEVIKEVVKHVDKPKSIKPKPKKADLKKYIIKGDYSFNNKFKKRLFKDDDDPKWSKAESFEIYFGPVSKRPTQKVVKHCIDYYIRSYSNSWPMDECSGYLTTLFRTIYEDDCPIRINVYSIEET